MRIVADSSSVADKVLPIVHASIEGYRLTLRRPWMSAKGHLGERHGWLVKLHSADGLSGVGDCAPLPEMGTESFELAAQRLGQWLNASAGQEPACVLSALARWRDTPAARFGVETAVLDLLAQHRGLPLARCLNHRARSAVQVNAALGELDDEAGARALSALEKGFTVLKVKLGVGAPEEELSRLGSLSASLPRNARFRLDANGAWNESEAQHILSRLTELPIESLEEPLARPAFDALARLQKQVPWPLALDEALHRISMDELLKNPPVRRIVLKPTVLGGLSSALQLARRAQPMGVQCVVTSTLESSAGVLAGAHLAAALNNDQVHGLSTSDWFLNDTAKVPEIKQGELSLGNMPGLGFVPANSL